MVIVVEGADDDDDEFIRLNDGNIGGSPVGGNRDGDEN